MSLFRGILIWSAAVAASVLANEEKATIEEGATTTNNNGNLRRRLDDYINQGNNIMPRKEGNYVGGGGGTNYLNSDFSSRRPDPPSYPSSSSSSAAAAAQDEVRGGWQMTSVNDGDNVGGSNYWAIADLSSGRLPMGVEEGAPDYSFFVAKDGNVGLGTSYPNANLHVVGAVPSIRLETGDSFHEKSWAISGTNRGFYVHEDDNGQSRLPLVIRPGASSLSMVLAENGGVGVGTDSPEAKLHVIGDARIDGSLLVGNQCQFDVNTCHFSKLNGRHLAEEDDDEQDKIVKLLQVQVEKAEQSIELLQAHLELVQATAAAKEDELVKRMEGLEKQLAAALRLLQQKE
ncbi:hypothetical protein ACA910_001576 [Epithemia clementina (nom. ined.)]